MLSKSRNSFASMPSHVYLLLIACGSLWVWLREEELEDILAEINQNALKGLGRE